MIRRPPRSTLDRSSAASDVYKRQYYWTFDEVASKMEAKIVKGLKDTHELSKKHDIDNRKAAMVLAVERVLEAFNHKGIWP